MPESLLPVEIMNNAYSVSLFTYRNIDGFANWPWATVRLKVHEEAGFEAKPELFGARLDARRNTTGPGGNDFRTSL